MANHEPASAHNPAAGVPQWCLMTTRHRNGRRTFRIWLPATRIAAATGSPREGADILSERTATAGPRVPVRGACAQARDGVQMSHAGNAAVEPACTAGGTRDDGRATGASAGSLRTGATAAARCRGGNARRTGAGRRADGLLNAVAVGGPVRTAAGTHGDVGATGGSTKTLYTLVPEAARYQSGGARGAGAGARAVGPRGERRDGPLCARHGSLQGQPPPLGVI
jgi:hypothetical protein